MTPAEILRQAETVGVTLAARDGRILARSAGSLPAELKQAISAQKVALLALLPELPLEVSAPCSDSGFESSVDRATQILGGEILDINLARLDLDEPHSLEANRKRIQQYPQPTRRT